MEIKFFNRDVIGRKPKKVGDIFKAQFMGCKATFVVTQFVNGCIFAEFAE